MCQLHANAGISYPRQMDIDAAIHVEQWHVIKRAALGNWVHDSSSYSKFDAEQVRDSLTKLGVPAALVEAKLVLVETEV